MFKEVIDKLGESKKATSGNIQVKTCPFCGREKWKFYIHETNGAYICHSGSCQAKGNIYTLAKHLGVKIENTEFKEVKQKNVKVISELRKFKADEFATLLNSSGDKNPECEDVNDFIESRGISVKTAKAMNVFKKRGTPFVTFAYQDLDGELKAVKYRSVKAKDFLQEKGSKSILWNIKNATNKKIIITEGEWDALTLAEIGLMDRATSMPMGATDLNWIDNSREFLEGKEEIILAYDNDEVGKRSLVKACQRLEMYNIKTIDLGNYKDINEFYFYEGAEALKKVLNEAKEVRVDGLTDLEDVGRFDINLCERFTFGIKRLDEKTRGAKEGDLIILAGDNGSGKTTVTKQLALSAIQQDKKVLYINGEVRAEIFKEDLFLQANGKNKFDRIEDKLVKGQCDYVVTQENYEKINYWLKDKFLTFSDTVDLKDTIVLEKIESAIKKENVFFIIVDNLTVISHENSSMKEFDAKGEFARALKRLAVKYGVCITLVNHFTKGNDEGGKSRIKGSGVITDVADLVLVNEIVQDEESEHSGVLRILKNRLKGQLGKIETGFDALSKRIFDFNNRKEETARNYKWELIEFIEDDYFDYLPF